MAPQQLQPQQLQPQQAQQLSVSPQMAQMAQAQLMAPMGQMGSLADLKCIFLRSFYSWMSCFFLAKMLSGVFVKTFLFSVGLFWRF